MKRSRAVATKLAIVAGLAATSSALTSLTVSTVQKAAATPPSAPAPFRDTTRADVRRATVGQSAPANTPVNQKGSKAVAMHAMNMLSVQMQDDIAVINAKASIMDVRDEMKYVWSVRVLDKNSGNVLFQKVYDDQVFGLPESRQMAPTFQDAIELPLRPGTYDMEVAAYQITPEDGLAPIRSPKRIDWLRGPWGMAKIKVGD